MDINIFKKLNFSDKHIQVYMALLQLGPSSVRALAEHSGVNRGTTYDILKWLQDEGVVNFYHKDKKQYFVAESPEKLEVILENRQKDLVSVKDELGKAIPELKAMYSKHGENPMVRYFDSKGIRSILEDVLQTTSSLDEKVYRVYSAVQVREFLYEIFPDYTDQRIQHDVHVKAIALGEGGKTAGLDERKWLSKNSNASTYIFIYGNKTAYISLNVAGQPIGVVIENQGIADVQKNVFDSLWENL